MGQGEELFLDLVCGAVGLAGILGLCLFMVGTAIRDHLRLKRKDPQAE